MNADGELIGELWTGGEVRRMTAAGRHLVCVLDDGRLAAHYLRMKTPGAT